MKQDNETSNVDQRQCDCSEKEPKVVIVSEENQKSSNEIAHVITQVLSQQNIRTEQPTALPCIDFFCHQKVDGLPFGEPSSICIETILRMMKLNYRIVQRVKPCENAFIMINKKSYNGSLGIVDVIKKMVGLDLNCGLFHRDAPVLRFATIVLESQTDSCLIYHRWVDQLVEWRQASSDFKGIGLFRNIFLESKIHKRIRIRLETLGLNFPTSEQVLCLLVRDFHALSILLGEKNFMFGKCPTSLDCVCFGIISTLLYSQVESNLKKIILSNFSNLLQHCERIRSIYWPDWEKVVNRVRPCSTPRSFFSFRKPKPVIPPVSEVVSTCDECLKKQQMRLTENKTVISSTTSQDEPQQKVFIRMSHSSSNLISKEFDESDIRKKPSLSSQLDFGKQIKKECKCQISEENLEAKAETEK